METKYEFNHPILIVCDMRASDFYCAVTQALLAIGRSILDSKRVNVGVDESASAFPHVALATYLMYQNWFAYNGLEAVESRDHHINFMRGYFTLNIDSFWVGKPEDYQGLVNPTTAYSDATYAVVVDFMNDACTEFPLPANY